MWESKTISSIVCQDNSRIISTKLQIKNCQSRAKFFVVDKIYIAQKLDIITTDRIENIA
ncbi:hypothetical protein GM3708_1999 [Geminocystis sp. NIES-3708]|uniref:hypothetical protein n=1 Tax=Geminocystis sp. NIES-3708 TaxID=1615909 RepID=UPI0005FC9338|nr:hypothetical protein [Geminocystis sp. NIES-3708]BAQ61593.1 hypothetical protein GM3708_1999 [Geminocystis sp. NIES-3708]